MKNIFIFLSVFLILIISCNNLSNMEENGLFAKLKTNKGEIIVKLQYELTPLTVSILLLYPKVLTHMFLKILKIKNFMMV